MISEIFLNVLDFYQARAEAGPYAPFEHAAFRDWLLQGRAEKISLFTYVFQERAPLRMDGWAKLAPEAVDLFYWTEAQVLLNGGLFELNYEFSALEDLNGQADRPAEHYYRFECREGRSDVRGARHADGSECAGQRMAVRRQDNLAGRQPPAATTGIWRRWDEA